MKEMLTEYRNSGRLECPLGLGEGAEKYFNYIVEAMPHRVFEGVSLQLISLIDQEAELSLLTREDLRRRKEINRDELSGQIVQVLAESRSLQPVGVLVDKEGATQEVIASYVVTAAKLLAKSTILRNTFTLIQRQSG